MTGMQNLELASKIRKAFAPRIGKLYLGVPSDGMDDCQGADGTTSIHVPLLLREARIGEEGELV